MPSTFEDPSNGVKRNGFTSIMALAKRNLEGVLSSLAKSEIFRVRIANEKAYGEYLGRIVSRLDSLTSVIKSLPKIEMKDSPASIQIQTMSEDTIGRMTKQLEAVKQAVLSTKQAPVRSQRVEGTVKVENMPVPQRFPVEEITRGLQEVQQAIERIKLESPSAPEIKFPKFPDKVSVTEGKAILKALQGLTDSIDEIPKKLPQARMPKQIEVSNFPIQKIPQPVTHVSINSLIGYVKSRAVTVTTTPTPLPEEVLAYRRSMVAYNNSSQTVYVGGSDVSTTNGIPVPAGTYSPAFDCGPRMIVYGVVASTTANVRTMELSDENSGR